MNAIYKDASLIGAPRLFGISKSNRDFSKTDNWGKNQFNVSFPASLLSYMSSKGLESVYIILDSNLVTLHSKISTSSLFGIEPESESLYYAFERDYSPYQRFVEGNLPRIDFVTMDVNNGACLKGLEIKLTALPDNTTHNLSEDNYAPELVVRPDTIVYLGISIIVQYEEKRKELLNILNPICEEIKDWTSIHDVLPNIPKMIKTFDLILLKNLERQQPLIVQPIWKTHGKAPILNENCLDSFVWSDYAFTRLFIDSAKSSLSKEGINRVTRTFVWLFKVLYDYALVGKFNYEKIIDTQSYNTKNDKAFALSGLRTLKYMKSAELRRPRISRDEIKNIILGGGHKLLSPERRFDAVIVNTPGLFDED